MLQIFKDFSRVGNGEKAAGNVSWFLKSVLIEVVAENYRHLMQESASYPASELNGHLFNPPLRSRERIISGIFATAIARVAPRSYPEYRVDRPLKLELSDESDTERNNKEPDKKAGRVDYLSFFHDRVITCELKSAFVNVDKINGESGYVTKGLLGR